MPAIVESCHKIRTSFFFRFCSVAVVMKLNGKNKQSSQPTMKEEGRGATEREREREKRHQTKYRF